MAAPPHTGGDYNSQKPLRAVQNCACAAVMWAGLVKKAGKFVGALRRATGINKRDKGQGPGEGGERRVPKMKRSFQEDPEVTDGSGLAPSTDSQGKPKANAGAQEHKEEKERESQEMDSAGSSHKGGKMTAPEQSQAKKTTTIALSQNAAGKFVPVFTKPKENPAERRKRNSLPRRQQEQEGTDCNSQNTDSSPEWKSSEATMQDEKPQAEAPEQPNLIEAQTEGDRATPEHQGQFQSAPEPDNPQTCSPMEKRSCSPEGESALPEQRGEEPESRSLGETSEETSLPEAPSVFPDIPDKSCQDRSPSTERLEHLCTVEINGNDAGREGDEEVPCAPGADTEENGAVKEGSGGGARGEQPSEAETGGEDGAVENRAGSSESAAAAKDCPAPAAGEERSSAGSTSGADPGACSLPGTMELNVEVALSIQENGEAPGPASHVLREGGSGSQGCSASLQPPAPKGETDGEEAEKEGKASPGTSSVPDSPICIHGASARKRKQEELPEEGKENAEPSLDSLGEPPDLEIPQGKMQILEAGGKATPCPRGLRHHRANAEEAALAGEATEPIPMGSASPREAAAGCAEKPAPDGRKFLPAAEQDLPDGEAMESTEPEAESLGAEQPAPGSEPSAHIPSPQPVSTDAKSDSSTVQSELGSEEGQKTLEKTQPVTNISNPEQQQPSAEPSEALPNASQQEDATDVVCGLIAELSKLNRLIMSAHRDLESLKRLKYRKSRRSGKFPASRGAPVNPSPGRKWKDT